VFEVRTASRSFGDEHLLFGYLLTPVTIHMINRLFRAFVIVSDHCSPWLLWSWFVNASRYIFCVCFRSVRHPHSSVRSFFQTDFVTV